MQTITNSLAPLYRPFLHSFGHIRSPCPRNNCSARNFARSRLFLHANRPWAVLPIGRGAVTFQSPIYAFISPRVAALVVAPHSLGTRFLGHRSARYDANSIVHPPTCPTFFVRFCEVPVEGGFSCVIMRGSDFKCRCSFLCFR